MNRIKFLAVVLITTASVNGGAGVPVQNFSLNSIGLEYSSTMRGQFITDSDIASHESIHLVSLNYAPVPYILFSAGLGADRFTVDEYDGIQFEGGFGLSPELGLSLFSPWIFGGLRISGGISMLYFNSGDSQGYVYNGPVFNPYAGLIFPLGKAVDLGIGARGYIIAGSMGNERTDTFVSFSNRNKVRGYIQVTLHAPEGAYLNLDADLSPEVSSKIGNGFIEASLGASIGFILRAPEPKEENNIEDKYFPAYKEMKEIQKGMELED